VVQVRVTAGADGVEGVTRFAAVDAAGAPVAGPCVAIVGLMHGNEPVGLRAIERFVDEAPGLLRAGSVCTVLANLEGLRQGKRYSAGGTDMNRLWDEDRLALIARTEPDKLCYEERRVHEIAPFLLQAEVVLDLHSTSQPSLPHLVFRDDLRHAEIAKQLGVARLVTGVHTGAVLEGGLAADVGLARGALGPRLGFTLEAGQHTNPDNVHAAWDVVVRLLHALGMWAEAPAPIHPNYEVFEVTDRFVQAPAGAEPYRLVGYAGGEAGGGRRQPRPRLMQSFEPVEADEIVLRRGKAQVVRAHAPFTMLMPAPTALPGEDLFYYTQRRHAALRERPTTDAAARLEASAIESYDDLLADDEAQRGVVTASFEPRRTLDLCAAILERAVRLPPGHPHRRITVVGRGDAGGDEHELRYARRYQRAMQRALAAGVPVDRFQLLRGVSFGWLEQLTAAVGVQRGDHGGLRLFLSTRQAHTVSLLVLGDLERALADGDLHHVRVAVLIEATTVEAEQRTPQLRTARAGLFGARHELLEIARAYIAGLKSQHRALLADGVLSLGPDGEAMLDEDGGLRPRSASQALVLRDALYALQLQMWREVLGAELHGPRLLDSDDALGGWLSKVMVSTGILDAAALRRLLVEQVPGGYRVDPGRIAQAPPVESWRVEVKPSKAPPPVLAASEVDRDNIERWIGWKRFLREAQSFPGHQGRDISLLRSGAEVRRTMSRWAKEAEQRAAAEPGQWLLLVAGDGLNPQRELGEDGLEVLEAQRSALCAGELHYVRIQHAQGTYLAWMKGFVRTVVQRTPGEGSLSLCWETEHGGSVNVVLLARWEGEGAPDARSLDGWTIERCAVVLSELEGFGANEYQLGLVTAVGDHQQANQELLHFGRAHCGGLLKQAEWSVTGQPGPALLQRVGQAIQGLVHRWIERVRASSSTQWREAEVAARRLGIRDPWLRERVVQAALSEQPSAASARQIWESVEPWPDATVGERIG
jgi:predicted deacylase